KLNSYRRRCIKRPERLHRRVGSNSNRRLNGWVRLIPVNHDIARCVIEKRRGLPAEFQLRQRHRLPCELKTRLLQMVGVEVYIPARPYEFPRSKIALMGDHVG